MATRPDPFTAYEAPPTKLERPMPMSLPQIAPGFVLTKGRKPRTGEARLEVQFRGGYVDRKHTYKSSDLRWDDTGHPFDVIAVRRVG